jgi:hypothetical protein
MHSAPSKSVYQMPARFRVSPNIAHSAWPSPLAAAPLPLAHHRCCPPHHIQLAGPSAHLTYQYRLKTWTKLATRSANTWPGMGSP